MLSILIISASRVFCLFLAFIWGWCDVAVRRQTRRAFPVSLLDISTVVYQVRSLLFLLFSISSHFSATLRILLVTVWFDSSMIRRHSSKMSFSRSQILPWPFTPGHFLSVFIQPRFFIQFNIFVGRIVYTHCSPKDPSQNDRWTCVRVCSTIHLRINRYYIPRIVYNLQTISMQNSNS